MDNLIKKAILGYMQFIVGLGILLFVPAGTFVYWQAWVYMALFGASMVLIVAYLYKYDPILLERRMKRMEKEKSQQLVQFFIYAGFISEMALPSFDHRFLWSHVPSLIVLMGDVAAAISFYIYFIVLRENTYAGRTIEMSNDQKVIATGPYAIVRHPMYSGAIIMNLGTPIALGSWWGL